MRKWLAIGVVVLGAALLVAGVEFWQLQSRSLPPASPISVPTANVPEPLERLPLPRLQPTTASPDRRERMRRLGIITGGPCIDVGDVVEHLATGTYSFNKPDSAYVDIPIHIALALKTTSNQDVGPWLNGLPGQVTERSGRFAQSLEATLHGDDMLIDPVHSGARRYDRCRTS